MKLLDRKTFHGNKSLSSCIWMRQRGYCTSVIMEAVLPVLIRIGQEGRFQEPAMVIQHQGHSVDEERQEGPHVHSIHPCRFGKGVLVCDLGLDRISRCVVREQDGGGSLQRRKAG